MSDSSNNLPELPALSQERLTQIAARLAAATPGPWVASQDEMVWRLHGRGGLKQILKAPKRDTPYAEYWPDKGDGPLITHAWQDIYDLLAEVLRQQREIDRLKGLTAT